MHPNDPFNYNPTAAPLDRPSSNGLGIAGFVVSLVGLFSCGCLSIIGVIISAIALSRRPRGFAIAGLIIGIVGLLLMALLVILAVTFGGMIIIPATLDGYKVNVEIQAYKQSHNGALPKAWSDLPGMATGMNDHWGHPYHFKLLSDNKRIELLSDGPDGVAGNSDDVTVLIEDDFVTAHMGHMPRPLQPR